MTFMHFCVDLHNKKCIIVTSYLCIHTLLCFPLLIRLTGALNATTVEALLMKFCDCRIRIGSSLLMIFHTDPGIYKGRKFRGIFYRRNFNFLTLESEMNL